MTTARRRRYGWMSTTVGVAVILAFVLGSRTSAHRQTVEKGKGTMTLEQNKATARRWSEELWSRGNLAIADEIIASDYVRHDPGDPFPARGPEDVKRIVTDAADDAAGLHD